MTTATNLDTDHGFGTLAPSDYHIDSDGYIAFFAGFWAIDPERGKTKHGVTHDTVVDADGRVEIQLNGVPLSELGKRSGSYTR